MRRLSRLALGLLVLLLYSSRSEASVTTKKGTNPRTGKPIVSRSSTRLSEEELQRLVATSGFADAGKAAALATRESGRYPDVVLDTRGMSPSELAAYWGKRAMPELSVGLWQINLLANAALVPGNTLEEKIAALQDPSINAHVALLLSKGGTQWGPWGG